MRFRDLAFLVVSNLRRMKLRLALTSLGVVIGTSAIVLMVSLGIGLQANLTAQLGDLGAATHINVFGGGGMPGAEAVSLDQDAVDGLAAIEHVAAVLPSVPVMADNISYKKYVLYSMPYGVDMDDFEKFGYEIEEGRLPRNDSEILLGATLPASFSIASGGGMMIGGGATVPELDVLGKRLVLTASIYPTEEEYAADPNAQPRQVKHKFTVVGILAPSGMMTDQSAYITMEAALDLNSMDRRKVTFDQLIVKADSVNSVTDIEKTIMDRGFYAYSAQSTLDSLKNVFLIIQGVLGALGGIAMLVAALGIANTMTMSIYERTREIGIMKAVGASNRQIKRVFLGEAAIIGVLGGVVGVLFSGAGAALANLFVQAIIAGQATSTGVASTQTTSFFQIPVWLAVFAIVFAAGIGLLSGVLPAVRAANLDPLTALRHE
jgi:putative ABC transport system permease protein